MKNGNGGKGKRGPAIVDRKNFGSVQKTEATSIEINLVTTEDGTQAVDVRNWFTTQYAPDTKQPSSKGIWLPVEDAAEVAQAVLKAVKYHEEESRS